MSRKYSVKTSIIPVRLIYENKIYSITSIDDDYIINDYEIFLDDDRITAVKIDADHPNSDPNTDLFCLPEELKNRYLSKSLIRNIEVMIETYNLNNCYFMPWHYIQYDIYDSKRTLEEHGRRENSIIMKSFQLYNKIRNFGVSIIDN